MNANRNFNNNANRNNSKKPYCKVCHDAGKPESMYTSHCVKTYNINTGKTDTTCPTLLALECRYCYKSGHTVKFCPVLEENKKMDAQRARERARPQQEQRQEQQQVVQKPKNAFAALADDSDDECEVPKVQTQKVEAPIQVQAVDEFPALMGNTRVAQNSNAKSYSCVAATPADERRLEMLRQQRLQQAAQVEAQKKAVSWADEEDSEDEAYESASEAGAEEEEVKVVVSQYGSSAYFQPTAPSTYSYLPRATADDDDW
jgi:hypothetical protein